QAALQLNPGHIEALMLIASVMEELELYDLAVETYDRVPRQDPAYLEAQIGRAEALRRNERFEASIEALSQLSKLYPENFMVQLTLGDTYGRVEAWEDALTAYNRAISLRDPAQAQDWRTFYARGVALERLKRMEESEADFRAALAIEPENPRVLNYLGYSLVEEGRKLDEALQMIELAVSKRPEDGYIVDSLGWVYYRLGRYEEAVDPMERAAMLMSTDPIVNDHLGDVYWAVGRKIEADFQWRRALSFGPEPEEADRIRRKLEVGLDQVLEEEGADYIPFPDEG
ncbi:MAG: tetratricopeptide repeat protein, partial [Mangrovicoccus sp.]